MEDLKRLATGHPITFAFVVTLLLLAIYFAAAIAAALLAQDGTAVRLLNGAGRFAGALLLIGLLWRLGWRRAAWFTRLGSWVAWSLVLVLSAYEAAVALYAFRGDLALGFSWSCRSPCSPSICSGRSGRSQWSPKRVRVSAGQPPSAPG